MLCFPSSNGRGVPIIQASQMVLCNIFPRKAQVAPPGLSHFEPMVLLLDRLPMADSHRIPKVS